MVWRILDPTFSKTCIVLSFVIPSLYLHIILTLFLLSPDCLYEFAGVSGGAPLQTYSLSEHASLHIWKALSLHSVLYIAPIIHFQTWLRRIFITSKKPRLFSNPNKLSPPHIGSCKILIIIIIFTIVNYIGFDLSTSPIF